MLFKKGIPIIITLVLCCYSLFGQTNEVLAKIVAKKQDNLIDIRGVVQNPSLTIKDEYSYLLFSLKKGENGNYSRNSQSGMFSLEPNEIKELAQLKINLQENEELKVYVFIRKYKVLIAKDSLVFGSNLSKKTQAEEENDFVIKGIVVDNVLTKIGKDFHDYFYQSYTGSGKKHPFIININEKPYFGRSSVISIVVEDKKLMEFYADPKEEILKAKASEALQIINSYALQRKLYNQNNKRI